MKTANEAAREICPGVGHRLPIAGRQKEWCDICKDIATAMQAFADQAVAEAVKAVIGDVIKEATCVQSVGEGEYARGWHEAMRFVEGVVKAIRARGNGGENG